jgi:hypothetical protein
MEHLSLWEVCEGNLEGKRFTGDPEVYIEEGSRVRHFSSLGTSWYV